MLMFLKSISCSFLIAGICFASRCEVSAEDWPQFRGPDGQGHSSATGLPVRWSLTENVVWKAPIPGVAWSSPVFHEGRIYLTTAVPLDAESENSDQSLRALCVDARMGEVLWNAEVFLQADETAPKIHSKNSHASPTPIVADGRVYLHFGHQGTACLDLDGKVVWKNSDIKYRPVHGNGGSPSLVDGLLIFSCDGADKQIIVALDAASGRVVWQTERPTEAVKKFSFSTPLAIAVGGRQQIISPGSDMVCALDAKTGEEIWRCRYQGYSVIPRPVYGHGLLFISTGYDSPEVMAIRPDGEGDVTETHVAWRLSKGAPHTPSLLLVGDELYMISDRGIASCLDAKTGEPHWQERIGGNFSASPLYADGHIYLQSEQGTGIVIAAGKKFEEIARNELDERTLASYAVADGALLIRTESQLYRVQE
jgi:outer membrane protein assembly factor BamB